MKGDIDVPPHEADGLIQLSRVNGSMNLFGSPIRPMHFIEITITEGRRYHGLGQTRYFNGPTIATVAMSEVQFAEAITTMNSGVGTPCTLRDYRDGTKLKQCEEPPQQMSSAHLTREEFKAKVNEKLGAMREARDQIGQMLSDAKVSEKRRAEVLDAVNQFMRLFNDSAPFMMRSFEENTAESVAAAKAEITAHADFVLRSTGIATLQAGGLDQLDSGSQT